jgi:CHASE3 domain sensor protein
MTLNPWKKIRQLEERLKQQVEQTDGWAENFIDTSDLLNAARNALRAIAAEEKPTSNATVKRMAAMAREGLKQ